MLPLFDLPAEIEKYNQTHPGSPCCVDENFGCDSLRKKRLDIVNQLIHSINEGHLANWFTEEEQILLSKQNNVLGKLQQACFEHDFVASSQLKALREESASESRRKKLAFVSWQLRMQKQLNNSSLWEAWLNHPNTYNKPLIQKLHQSWQHQESVGCWHTETLNEVAEDLLPLLIEQHTEILNRLWLSYFFMPALLYNAYKNYLKVLIKEAKLLKQKILLAKLARLQALHRSHFEYEYPLLDICEQLQACGAILPEPIVYYEGSINKESFAKLNHTVYQQGEEHTKSHLTQMRWYQPGNGIALVKINSQEKIELIPERLLSYVPSKDTYFPAIFVGHHVRYTFLKGKLLLLAQLNEIPLAVEMIIHIKKLEPVERLIQALQKKQTCVEEALNELTQPPISTFTSSRLGKTKQFLKEWQNLLLEYRNQLIEQKLQVAEEILVQLSSQRSIYLISWQACHLLQCIHASIEEDLKTYQNPITKALQLRWQTNRDKAAGLLGTHRAVNILRYLSQGKAIDDNEASYLLDFYRNTQLYDPIQAREFQAYHELALDLMLDHLKNLLKQAPTEIHDPKKCIQRLEYCHHLINIISVLGNNQQQKQLNEMLQKKLILYFLNYLSHVLQTKATRQEFVKHTEIFTALESILLKWGDKISFGGKTLQAHTLQLRQYREKPAVHLMQTHAAALAKTLAKTLFEQRLEKDTERFIQQVFHTIEGNAQLNYNSHVMEVLKRIRNTMQIKGIEHVKDMASELDSYERTLIGLAGGQNTTSHAIPELLSLTFIAEKSIAQFKEQKDIQQQIRLAQLLAQSLQETLQQNPLTKKHPEVMQNKTKKRLLFYKQDIDIRLLLTTKSDHLSH